jgi:AcrR family transcriptional regulator
MGGGGRMLAMRVEDIAARSGVNKTTIYRRWPTKAKLLKSALIESAKKHGPSIDTGTLRGDLHTSPITAFKLRPYEQGLCVSFRWNARWKQWTRSPGMSHVRLG